MEEIDKKILAAAKKKNFKAFEVILCHYERAIFDYIFRLVNHRQDAEDLAQETFIKVYVNLDSIDPEKNFRAWLYKIATNVVYDWFRKKGAHPELFIIDDPLAGFETIDEESTYLKIERTQDLLKALAGIKPIYRMILELFYHQGLSYEEVAQSLAIPLNTVKTHLFRAKKALKQILERGS